jgi:ureidoglycolate lyase
MAGPGLLKRTLRPAPIDPAAFAPFGTLVSTEGRPFDLVNAGTTRRHSDLASLDLRGPGADPVLGIYVAKARAFPLRIAELERHREAAQVFMPLGMHRFVVLVAPGGDTPGWGGIAAFVTGPGEGVVLRRGCWHHGLVALGDGDRFAVIEGAGYRRDTELVPAPFELELLLPE